MRGSLPASPSVPSQTEAAASGSDLIARVMAERQTAWVVLGSSGQWSDWSQWPVAVFASEQDANDYVGLLSAAMRVLWEKKPDMDRYDYESGAWARAQTRWGNRVRKLDPGADEYDEARYTAQQVPALISTTPAVSQAQAGHAAAEPRSLLKNPHPERETG